MNSIYPSTNPMWAKLLPLNFLTRMPWVRKRKKNCKNGMQSNWDVENPMILPKKWKIIVNQTWHCYKQIAKLSPKNLNDMLTSIPLPNVSPLLVRETCTGENTASKKTPLPWNLSKDGVAPMSITISPQPMFHLVLPVRSDNKLTFPLCAARVKQEQANPMLLRRDSCCHTPEERMLRGTYCTPDWKGSGKRLQSGTNTWSVAFSPSSAAGRSL